MLEINGIAVVKLFIFIVSVGEGVSGAVPLLLCRNPFYLAFLTVLQISLNVEAESVQPP